MRGGTVTVWPKRMVVAFLYTGMIAAVCVAADAPPGWWDDSWRCRKTVQVIGAGPEPAVVVFTTGGMLKSDAADLRILDEAGRSIPYSVIASGFEDLCTVAFPVEKGQTTFQLYYGHRLAERPEMDWQPRRGLVLEVRSKGQGGFNSWEEMRALLDASSEVQGRGLHPCVFDGGNRFGPSDNYISIYRGFLECPASGTYAFATTSDDASFLLIDSNMVTAWPGSHGAVGDARHQTPLQLEAGVHRFEYYHVDGVGDQVAEAAWRLPGSGSFEVIPPKAFTPLAEGRVVDYRMVDDDAPIDFDFWQETTLIVGDTLMACVQFRVTFPKSIQMLTPNWDFGDGTVANRRAPAHVYACPGLYHVTLRLGDRQASQDVRVWENEALAGGEPDAVAAEYAKVIATYDLDEIQGGALPVLATFGNLFGRAELEQQALAALVNSEDAYIDGALGYRLIERADALRRAGQLDDALALLRQVALRHRVEEVICRALRERGRLFLTLGMDEDAEETYDRLKNRSLENPAQRAVGLAGLGDVCRHRGDATKAKEYYAQAQALCGTEPGTEARVRGGHAQALMAHLRNGRADAALDEARRWEDVVPMDRIQGYLSVLESIALMILGELGTARAELEDVLAANPSGNFAGEAVLLLGDCLALSGKTDDGVKCYQRVLDDYRESPARNFAEARIQNPPTTLEYLPFPILDSGGP